MVEPGGRQVQIEGALSAFRDSAWGMRTSTHEGAAGLCKRSSLVVLVHLERQGIDDAQLWHLGHPREGSDFALSDEHYVVVLDGEAIDPSARQFDPDGPAISRLPLGEVEAPWYGSGPVDIGYIDPLIRIDLHRIPANWRELADAEPPGTSIGWEVP